MTPEQIAELLAKTVDAVLTKQTPAAQSDDKVTDAVANLAKAVTAINTRLEDLSKVAVKTEPETVETQLKKVVDIVGALSDKVNKIASGEKIEPADENIDLSKMTKKDFEKMIRSITGKGSESSPEGEGKDDLASILKSIVAGKKTDDDTELDLDDIEVEDNAGNTLNKKARTGRKALDDWFGKKIGASSARHLGIEEEEEEDADVKEDDSDEDDE